MTDSGADNDPRTTFDRLLSVLRPKLHRYCARMTGSVIDGEDVLQEALVKALESFEAAGPITHPESWLFRIAHNSRIGDWRLALGFVDRRPATLVRDPDDVPATPLYFVLLQWSGNRVVHIRDFRNARYVTDGAEIITISALS